MASFCPQGGDRAEDVRRRRADARRAVTGEPRRGQITYDDQHGHVCTCTQAVEYDEHGEPREPSYLPTVAVARDVEPTESGSYWYVCSRCGAGGWSGC